MITSWHPGLVSAIYSTVLYSTVLYMALTKPGCQLVIILPLLEDMLKAGRQSELSQSFNFLKWETIVADQK